MIAQSYRFDRSVGGQFHNGGFRTEKRYGQIGNAVVWQVEGNPATRRLGKEIEIAAVDVIDNVGKSLLRKLRANCHLSTF